MEETQIMQALKEFGLTEKEIQVYLANLQLGTSKVHAIAKQAGILRETTYSILKSLIEKGLVGYVIKSGVKYFETAPPNKLFDILKEREAKINNIMPSLLALEKSIKEKPKVELFEGKEGLKTIIDDFIKTKKEMAAISSTKSLTEKLPYYFPNYIRRRIKEKIFIKVLTEKTAETEKMKTEGKKELREVRFIPKEYEFPNAIFIYGDKIAILDLEKNLTGIMIQNSELTQTFKMIFNFAWDMAEK